MDGAASHIDGLVSALSTLDRGQLSRWGRELAGVLSGGGRLLVAGNGGSAAQAQHLTAELVGRFRVDRGPLSAWALHADTSSLTALGNDFGFEQVYARQVGAHGRAGDVLLVLSTSGRSPNLIAAISQARGLGLVTWALTGPAPNPLADVCDEHVAVTGEAANVQECHLVAVHLLCAAVDDALAAPAPPTSSEVGRREAGPRRLVVVGDLLVDETLRGEVERICPDGPVPVVQSLRRTLRPGGAGLAALLAAQDGHDVTLITAHSRDDAATTALAHLSGAGVTVVNLGTDTPTAVKTRIQARGQTLLMLDRAEASQGHGDLPAEGRGALEAAAAVLVCDYGRGVAASKAIRALLTDLAPRVPVVWDPHPRGPAPVLGVAVATPNAREAAHFCGDAPGGGLGADVGRARRLLRLWGAGHVVVTRDRDGAVMVGDDGGPPLVVPAPFVSCGDACGAGDRFAVAVTGALARGVLPSVALPVAVAAATAYVSGAARPARAAGGTGTADSKRDAWAVAAAVHERDGTVVATGGCFDLLHRGHVALLEQARRLGDCLIVCLNDDASVTRLKGDPRPLVTVADRAGVLLALECVDGVVVFAEDTPTEVLTRLRPHLYVKGGDYAIGELPEAAAVERGGGQVMLLPYLDGRSTTSLINRAVLGTQAVGRR